MNFIEVPLNFAATNLEVPRNTIRGWIKRGFIEGKASPKTGARRFTPEDLLKMRILFWLRSVWGTPKTSIEPLMENMTKGFKIHSGPNQGALWLLISLDGKGLTRNHIIGVNGKKPPNIGFFDDMIKLQGVNLSEMLKIYTEMVKGFREGKRLLLDSPSQHLVNLAA